ncbi:hypothetical protein [Oceanirhabdus seepicola]|uniref:Uncharacterized protein n=1 Tax=Oceanirhabdus seepicola TaxID=2828781 RepID=A0A9J6NW98_9CLOT|nr:hypothetical protein [Oceanirhabdus seepicola]MCM1988778.1 hypothetical protein [Oceanirhabdus seepicola]
MRNVLQNVKNDVIELINQSGVKPEELIHEISSMYKVENTTVNNESYYDSFIE